MQTLHWIRVIEQVVNCIICAQRARYLLEGIFHGGNIAGQHHRAGKRSKPISTAPDLVAISQAIIDASLGVMVEMPIAETASGRPSFLKRIFLLDWQSSARVICFPGTYSESCDPLSVVFPLSLHHLSPHGFMRARDHRSGKPAALFFFPRAFRAGNRHGVVDASTSPATTM